MFLYEFFVFSIFGFFLLGVGAANQVGEFIQELLIIAPSLEQYLKNNPVDDRITREQVDVQYQRYQERMQKRPSLNA